MRASSYTRGIQHADKRVSRSFIVPKISSCSASNSRTIARRVLKTLIAFESRVQKKRRNLAQTHAMQTRPESFKSERQFLALLPTLKILAFLRCIFQRFHNELTGSFFSLFLSAFSFPFIHCSESAQTYRANVKFRLMFSLLYKSPRDKYRNVT